MRKKINVDIMDTERENFLEISAYRPRKNYLSSVSTWANKEIFGLKYSLWIVLFIVAISFVPLVISLAVQDGIPPSLQSALRIGGIALVSTGIGSLLIYLVSTRVSLGGQVKLYDEVGEFVQNIINLIDNYKEGSASKKVCWSCFEDIKEGISKCPHCGIDL